MTDVRRLLAEATPLPWKQDVMYVVGQVPEGRPGGEVIAQCGPTAAMLRKVTPDRANAALIVHAVNNLPAHEEAVEALERLVANAERIFDQKPVRDWTETLAEARAALARLRGDA